MRFDKNGDLIVAESYSGLYRINLATKEWTPLVTEVDGRRIHLANDLDIRKSDGMIYFSDSSDRWGRNRIVFEILSGRDCGRVSKLEF